MAEAKAVSFRKGTSTEHETFRGVEGEVTVDLTNKTVWVHKGDGNKGTPLARADFGNLEQTALNNGGIADRGLTNVSISEVSTVRDNLIGLGYAYKDASNLETNKINTTDLATASRLHTGTNKNLAYSDLSNITDANYGNPAEAKANISTVLATNADDVFVRYDMSNVQTNILAGASGTLPVNQAPLAYKDLSNIDTTNLATNAGHAGTNLAYETLSNIDLDSTSLAHVWGEGIQVNSNLISLNAADPANVNTYPTAISVKQTIDNLNVLPNLPTESSLENLVLRGTYHFENTITVSNGGSNYAVDDVVTIESSVTSFDVKVSAVDTNGTITAITPDFAFTQEDRTEVDIASTTTGSGTGATFTIASSRIVPDTMANYNWSETINSINVSFDNTSQVTGYSNYIKPRVDVGDINTLTDALQTLGLTLQDRKVITNIAIGDDIDAIITVTVSDSITTHPAIKTLIGSLTISGTWAGSGTTWTFTPDVPSDILNQSWIITLS